MNTPFASSATRSPGDTTAGRRARTFLSRPLAWWLFLSLVVAVGCAPQPPLAPLRGTLKLPPQVKPPATATGPARVVFAAPTGQAPSGADVAVVFDGPVRALAAGAAGAQEPPIDARIEPAVPGQWQWVGTSALRFAPKAPLPAATAFEVVVGAGVPRLPGRAMREDYRFRFETPRPRLLSSDPPAGQKGVSIKSSFSLTFNQPMDLGQLASAVTLRASGVDAPILIDIGRDEHAEPETATITPRAPLPQGATIKIELSPELRSRAGPLSMGRAASVELTTQLPFQVLRSSCKPSPLNKSKCDPAEPLSIELAGMVNEEDLLPALSVVPKLPMTIRSRWPNEHTTHFEIDLDGVKANTRYKLQVAARVGGTPFTDDDGRPLTQPHTHSFAFGDYGAVLELAGGGTYWPAHRELKLRVHHRNVNNIQVRAATLTPEQVIAHLKGSLDNSSLRFGMARTLTPSKRNVEVGERVPMADLLGPARGPILVEATAKSIEKLSTKANHRHTQMVQRTEVALYSTITHHHLNIWVTGLSSGKPHPGAVVRVRRLKDGHIIGSGTTGANGLVKLALPAAAKTPAGQKKKEERYIAFAKIGNDWAYQPISRPDAPPAQGLIFTGRGLYRPGETVHLKGIVRAIDPSGSLATPTDERVTIVVHDSKEREVRRFAPKLSAFGSWHRKLALSADAPLGLYRVQLLSGGKRTFIRARFQVAEYEPTEFTMKAKIDARRYLQGDTLSCVTTGSYLHGGPMAGTKVLLGLERSTSSWQPRRLSRYYTGALDRGTPPQLAGRRRAKLDDRGSYRYESTLTLPGMNGPEQISCNAYGSDLDERSLAAGDSTLVHYSDAYLGIRHPSYNRVYRGEPFEVAVLATDIDGQPRPLDAEVRLFKRTRAGDEHKEDELALCKVRTGSSDVICKFDAPDEPFHWHKKDLVVRATARAPNGAKLVAAFDTTPEERVKPAPPAPRPEPAEPPARYLRLYGPWDHPATVGNPIRVKVRSPFTKDATALIMVQRQDVYWQKQIVLPPSGTTLDIPVTQKMVPHAYVSVVAFDGVDSRETSMTLEVSTQHRKLDVQLLPATKRSTPGASIDVAVRVRDQQGKPVKAEVTLYAADEATLALSYYRTPDPMLLYGAISADIWDTNTRNELFTPNRRHRSRAPRVRMGATSISGRDVRTDFRQTVFFEPGLVTDDKGWVRHRVTLPDGLTSYRFMAVAVTKDDAFGWAEENVVANKKLMVRAKMPAIVRAGDTFTVNAIVSAHTKQKRRVTVGIATKGVELRGPRERVVTLKPNVPTSVKLLLSAQHAGPFELIVGAHSEQEGLPRLRDAMKHSGTVEQPMFIETVALHGTTDKPVAEALGDLSTIRKDVGDLTVSLSSSRFAGLDTDFDALLQYPYGCTEQTASRMLPIVALGQLASEIGAQVPANKQRMLTDAVNRLHNAQQPDGGFGLWARSDSSNPWLTAYVTWVLSQARRASVPVPQSLLDAAAGALDAYLRKALVEPSRLDTEQWSTTAFVVDVLGAIGKPQAQAVRKLYETRQDKPIFGRAVLLHAMASLNADKTAVEKLASELGAGITLSGEAAYVAGGDEQQGWGRRMFASKTTAHALTLRALAAAKPQHPLIHKLATGLINGLRSGPTRTTHDSAWTLVALDAYRRAHPSAQADFEARIFLGNDLALEHHFAPGSSRQRSISIAANKLARAPGRLTFDVRGTGSLHYRARLRYAQGKLPQVPVSAGMSVDKVMQPVDELDPTGMARAPSKQCAAQSGQHTPCFAAGELIRVEVRLVATTTRHHVVVDDPVPGGLRAVDPTMRTGLEEGMRGPAHGASGYNHRELRDDRVLFFIDKLTPGIHTFTYWARARSRGTYVLPPAQASEMYAPEVRGATPAMTVTIR